jgi:hypothetical protein
MQPIRPEDNPFKQGWLHFHVEAFTILGVQVPHLMSDTTTPIQERSKIHADGGFFAAIQPQVKSWWSPGNLIFLFYLNPGHWSPLVLFTLIS